MKILAIALITFLASTGLAQSNPVLSEAQKTELLSAYKSAIIVSDRVQAQQLLLQQKIAAYTDAVTKALKADGFPEGTTVSVDIDKEIVTVNLPEKKK